MQFELSKIWLNLRQIYKGIHKHTLVFTSIATQVYTSVHRYTIHRYTLVYTGSNFRLFD